MLANATVAASQPLFWAALLAYAALNLAAMVAFYADKRAAVRKRGRISERALLALALLGPFGAAAGMRLFRHKTRKPKFLLVYLFLVAHLAVIAYMFFGATIGI